MITVEPGVGGTPPHVDGFVQFPFVIDVVWECILPIQIISNNVKMVNLRFIFCLFWFIML